MKPDLFHLQKLVLIKVGLSEIGLKDLNVMENAHAKFVREIKDKFHDKTPLLYSKGKLEYSITGFGKRWKGFFNSTNPSYKNKYTFNDCIPQKKAFSDFLNRSRSYFKYPTSNVLIHDQNYDSLSLYIGCYGKEDFKKKYETEIEKIRDEWLEEKKDSISKNSNTSSRKNKKEEKNSFFSDLLNGSRNYFKERFEHLNMSEILIPKGKQEVITTNVKLDGENQETSLLKSIEKLWKAKYKNSLIVGDGGMGKTYSLISIWKHFLAAKNPAQIIPIYISLNRYNDASNQEKESYISNYIVKNYLKKRVISKEIETEFWEAILNGNKINNFKVPKIILLLDGFNEITTNSIALRKDLDDWWFSKAENVQTIITSRYDNRSNNRWDTLQKIILQPLSRKAIQIYLNKTKVDFPKEDELFELLSNPMMLTLYSASNENVNKYSDSSEFDFKPTFTSQGELMWNFFESQLAKLFDTNLYDDSTYKYYSFLLKHLTSLIGFKMEEKGQYNILEKDLVTIIDSASFIFYNEDFINTFPKYRGYLSEFDLSEKSFPENNQRFKIITDILCEKLQILSKEDYSYSFIHQNFRDFSASIYVVNDLQIANQKSTISSTIQNRPLPKYIRKYVGEIEGEHKKKVELGKKKLWIINNDSENSISTQLTLLRGKFDESIIGFSTWNIIEIYKDLRTELTGVDLSKLNLNKVTFEGIRCFRRSGDNFLSTNFNSSLINENSFLQISDKDELSTIGHSGSVTAISYSKDGLYIISGGVDKTVKIWLSKTKKCIKTFSPHKLSVKFAHYLPNKNTIVSGGLKVKIGFTNSEYEAHTAHLPSRSTCVDISNDSDHILFGFEEGKLIEFYLPTRAIKNEYKGYDYHSEIIAVSYLEEGTQIISCASNGKIINHKVGDSNGKIIRNETNDQTIFGASFSIKNKKILVLVADTKTYLEKLVETCLITGNILFEYVLDGTSESKVSYNHKEDAFIISTFWKVFEYTCGIAEYQNSYETDSSIKSLAYSPDDTKIIAGKNDGSFIEWSTQNRKELHQQKGNGLAHKIPSATFNKKGNTILCYSGGKYVNEWSVDKKEFVNAYELNNSHIHCLLQYSPDKNAFIACGLNNTRIEEFDIITGEKINEYIDSSANISSITYSLNSKKILAGSFRHVMEWHKNNDLGHKTNLRGKMLGIDNILFHPNGKTVILTSQNKIIEKNLDGEILRSFDGYFSGTINKVIINIVSNELIAIADGNTIIKWSIDEAQMTSEKKEHYGSDILDVHANYRLVFNEERNGIEYWKQGEVDPTFFFKYIEGLFINGCRFHNLHPKSTISENTKVIMKQYGALFD